jgi:hypothetical protein
VRAEEGVGRLRGLTDARFAPLCRGSERDGESQIAVIGIVASDTAAVGATTDHRNSKWWRGETSASSDSDTPTSMGVSAASGIMRSVLLVSWRMGDW